MANDAFGVDQEQSTERDAAIEKDVIVARNLLVQIGDERKFGLADSALIAWRVGPGQVGEVAVDRNTQNLDVQFSEFSRSIRECDDFGRTDEREVEGPKEQDYEFALVVA